MAELDRLYADRIAWLIRWRDRMAELIEQGTVSEDEFRKVEQEALEEIDRLRALRQHRIREVK